MESHPHHYHSAHTALKGLSFLRGRRFLPLILLFIILFLSISVFVQQRTQLEDTQPTYSPDEVIRFIKAKNSLCEKGTNYNECLDGIAAEMIKNFSFQDILSAYETIQEQNPQNSCHDSMHFIASNEYQKNKNLQDIFNQCTSVCFNACYHGAVLGYIEKSNFKESSQKTLEHTIVRACDSLLTTEKNIQRGNCIHGVGHSLMLISDNELPSSLTGCDAFTQVSDRENCYSGAFMENFPNSSSSDHPSRYVKANDPFYPCNSLEDKYLSTCYTFLTDYLNFVNKGDLAKTVSMCSQIPLSYRNECYQTIGSSAPGRVQGLTNMKDFCTFAPAGTPREFCIKGVVISFLDRYLGDDEQMLKMFDFCEIVDAAYKKACYTQLNVNLRQWLTNKQEQELTCSRIKDSKEKEWCLYGASN